MSKIAISPCGEGRGHATRIGTPVEHLQADRGLPARAYGLGHHEPVGQASFHAVDARRFWRTWPAAWTARPTCCG
jgi:hypothetical protein